MFPQLSSLAPTGGAAVAGPSSSDTGGVNVGGLTVTQSAPDWFWPVVAAAAVVVAAGFIRR